MEPEDTGFFNAGQKGYFWAIVGSVVAFLLSGVPMWFPEASPAQAPIGLVIHDIAALVMLGGFIVHTSTKAPHSSRERLVDDLCWARSRIAGRGRTIRAGIDKLTGCDPHSDYERALREQERDRSASRDGFFHSMPSERAPPESCRQHTRLVIAAISREPRSVPSLAEARSRPLRCSRVVVEQPAEPLAPTNATDVGRRAGPQSVRCAALDDSVRHGSE